MTPTRRPKHRAARLACGALALGLSCTPARKPAPAAGLDPGRIDAQRALEEVGMLVALGARESGTEGARRAAEHIAARLEHIGLDPIIDTFEDPTPRGTNTFRNVLTTVPGQLEQTLILVSHYDTKSGVGDGFVGANDSGSSTGLLIELARLVAQGPPLGPHVVFAFVDGEECMQAYGRRDGLHGSRHFVRTLIRNRRAQQVVGVIVLDMIGDRDLQIGIPRNSAPELISLAFEAAHAEGVRSVFRLAERQILDDHVPFLAAGMPAVNLIDFEYGSAPGRNDYWHTPEDTLDKLSARSLGITGRVVVRMLNALAASSGGLAAAGR